MGLAKAPQPGDPPASASIRISLGVAEGTIPAYLAPQHSQPQLGCWLCYIRPPSISWGPVNQIEVSPPGNPPKSPGKSPLSAL